MSDDLAADLQVLKTKCESVVFAGQLAHDPTVNVLDAIVDCATLACRAAARSGVTDEQMSRLCREAKQGAYQHTAVLVLAQLRRQALIAAAVLCCAVIVAAGCGYWAAGGFSPNTCQAQDGGVVCFRWATPPSGRR